MAIITLKGEVREGRGKGPARQARFRGLVPGVMYGKGEESLPFSINLKELVTVMAGQSGSNAIIDFKLAGQESMERKAILRDIQRDPISGQILHVDLMHIDMTREIEVDVPVHVSGLAIGVKDFGGILEFIVRSVPVRCLPTNIPDAITVDVSKLMVHDSVHVGDIQISDAEITLDAEQVIVTISSPSIDKAPGAEAAVVAAEPEVIGKKPAEGEGEPAKAGAKPEPKKDKK